MLKKTPMRAGTGRWIVAVCALGLIATSADAVRVDGGPLGRWTVGGYVEGYAVLPIDLDTRDQGPAGILDVTATGDVHRRARVFLDLRGIAGGTPQHAGSPGFVNLRDTFQNISPQVELEESWLDLFLPSVDVRIGKQKFAWGKLDTFQPTDVLNPRRYNDPFVTEEQDAKIGVPAVRSSYYPPEVAPRLVTDAAFTLVWIPFPVPPRFPLADERWFPPATTAPSMLTIPGSFLDRKLGAPAGTFPPLRVHSALRTRNAPPPWQLDEGAVGLRLSGLSGRADWALYYYDGPETLRAFEFQTTVFAASAPAFDACILRSDGACRLEAEPVLRPITARIRMAGGDAAYELHGVTARVEGAWFQGRLLPRTVSDLVSPENLSRALSGRSAQQKLAAIGRGKHVAIDLGDLFVARDTVEWGAGLDYHVHGWFPVLQVNQTLVLNNPDTSLLVNDVDTRLFFVVRKPFLADRLATETGIVQELERGYTAGIMRLTYSITDALRFRLGYLLIAGTRRSLVGEFHDNDELFFQLRWSY